MSANPPDLNIRTARVVERALLEDLQRRASLANEADRAALLAHPEAIDLPEAHIASGATLVAEREGQLLGFTVVLPRPDGEAELDGMFVDPTYWRMGIGRELLKASFDLARSLPASWIYVTANAAALDFYRDSGFTQCGQTMTQFAPADVMRRALAS